MAKLYAERDIEAQGEYYMRHLAAMTAEGLHSKSAIAGELAHRDMEINLLKTELHRERVEKTRITYTLKHLNMKCKECGAEFPNATNARDLYGPWHKDSCSLYEKSDSK